MKEKTNVKIIYVIVIFAIGILTYAGVSYNSYQTTIPSDVVKQYYELALSGKYDEALSLWTDDCNPNDDICAKATPISGENIHERWTKQINKYKDIIVNIESEKINKNQASVFVNTKTDRGIKSQTIYKLFNVNGNWKIYTYTSPVFEKANE